MRWVWVLVVVCVLMHGVGSSVYFRSEMVVNLHDVDVLLNDIDESDLYHLAEMEGAPYLSVSAREPVFPVEGVVVGANKRYMVNLLVRKKSTTGPYRNVVFMVDTGSPYTFLSMAAMGSMVDDDANLPLILNVEIQGTPPVICHLSPPDRHFADVNLLGMDFLEMKGAHLITDWPRKTFLLHNATSFPLAWRPTS